MANDLTRRIAQAYRWQRRLGNGVLAAECPKRLYARLGFHPVILSRNSVRELPGQG